MHGSEGIGPECSSWGVSPPVLLINCPLSYITSPGSQVTEEVIVLEEQYY